MQNKIWYKIFDVKLGEEYLRLYIQFQKKINVSVKIVTLVFSMSGILSWKFFEDFSLFVLILISLLQIFALIQSQIIRSEKDIEEIAALRVLYSSNLTRIEKLWLKFQKHELTGEQVEKKFFKFLDFERTDVLSIDDRLDIKDFKFLRNKAKEATLIYMKKYNS